MINFINKGEEEGKDQEFKKSFENILENVAFASKQQKLHFS